jgi:hypothetical protein
MADVMEKNRQQGTGTSNTQTGQTGQPGTQSGQQGDKGQQSGQTGQQSVQKKGGQGNEQDNENLDRQRRAS